jgi:hypothetical protein
MSRNDRGGRRTGAPEVRRRDNNNLRGSPGSNLPQRVLVVAIGLMGILWGVSEFSMFRREATINSISKRIIEGDAFKPEILLNQAELAEQIEKAGTCHPLMLRGTALARLRIAEMSGNPGLAPEPIRTNLATSAIRNSLACAPADPFLWLVLFGLEAPAPLSYLRASYRLGPNEGWIALKRNPLAFAKFEYLPADLRDTAVREFLGILEMDEYDEAMKILTGSAWRNKDFILAQLYRVPPRPRQNLANRLAADGYDVKIPGTNIDN